MLSFHLNYRSHSHCNHVHFHFSNLQAETVNTQYSNTYPSLDFTKPLVVQGRDKNYPRNPTNGYVSNLSDGFFSCLDCGCNSYIF